MADLHADQPSTISQEQATSIRVQSINNKLNIIEAGMEEEKSKRIITAEKKLSALDDKITKSTNADDTKFKLLKEQVEKLQEGVTGEQIIKDEYDQRKANELKFIESHIATDITLNKSAQKDIGLRNYKLADEKIFQIKLEFAKVKKLREEAEERILKGIGEQITSIEEEVDNEKKMREENIEKIIQKISEQITSINQTIEKEKKLKEDSQNSMFRMIEDMHTKLMQSIELERREREEAEDTLIKLLEDTCSHVESKILKYHKNA